MILCLREENDAADDARLLTSAGVSAMPASVINISYFDIALPEIEACQAVIYTSRYAIKDAHINLTSHAICVGQGSARTAKAAGFGNVVAGDAGAAKLLEMIEQRFLPDDGPLYWPHGSVVQMDLASHLRDAGFTVFEDCLYQLDSVQQLSEAVRKQVADDGVTAIMCFSVQHLYHFARLLEAEGLWHHHQNWALIVPSDRVANSVPAQWASRHIADAPSRSAMVALATSWAETAGG